MDRLPARHDPAKAIEFKRAKLEDSSAILDGQAVNFVDTLDGQDNDQ